MPFSSSSGSSNFSTSSNPSCLIFLIETLASSEIALTCLASSLLLSSVSSGIIILIVSPSFPGLYPRLDAKIIPEKCEAFPKGDRLIIRLRKAKNDDHWSYLFKQQYVGE